MTIQRVQLDISSDIFDKVMFFLESLPKNKVTLNVDSSPQDLVENNEEDIFAQTAGILSAHQIDPIEWQKEIRSEWD